MLEQTPTARFSDDWYFGAVCEHAEAFRTGELRRLVVTQPPGTYKSRLWAVALIAFDWLHTPDRMYLVGTNDEALGIGHAVACRRLLRSAWYRSLNPGFALTPDQDAKRLFANTQGGQRQVTSTGSIVSGKKADRIILDDVHDATKVHRPTQRNADKAWFRNSLWDRQKDFTESCIAVVGHQLNRDDLPNDLIREGWPHLNLMERFERRLAKVFPLGTVDPRREGQYLRPTRFGPVQEEEVKRTSGELVWCAKHQGDPRSAEGSDFPADKLPAYLPTHPAGTECVRYWDTAATVSESACYSSGTLIGRDPTGRFIVVDLKRGKWTPDQRNEIILRTAQDDRLRTGLTVRSTYVEQEPGGSGVEVSQILIRKLAGFHVLADRVTGDKRTRAQGLSAQWKAGNVYLIEAPWNTGYVQRMEAAHTADNSDDRDSSSGAFNKLVLATPTGTPTTGTPAVNALPAGTFGSSGKIDARTAEF